MARAIQPCFTMYDGDAIFCFSLGNIQVDEIMLGMMSTEAARLAIVNAVKSSVVIDQ